MILTRLIKNALRNHAAPAATDDERVAEVASVLNVGGNNKEIAIPSHYDGWSHFLLDIAPGPDVDVVLDARNLMTLDAGQFDAVYCSHNLEHYYRHDCEKVLAGFMHVLKSDGFVEIRVPDMTSVLRTMVANDMDIDDVLYSSTTAGPISVHDVIYGWGPEIERSGVDFFAHKRGFTNKSLTAALKQAGFAQISTAVSVSSFDLRAYAFKSGPTEAQKLALQL
jgi:hypothetical protein